MKTKDAGRFLVLFVGASIVSVVWQLTEGWNWPDMIGRSALVLLVCVTTVWLRKRWRE